MSVLGVVGAPTVMLVALASCDQRPQHRPSQGCRVLAKESLPVMALGRRAWLFAGSDRGGERAADVYSLIVTAKLNDVDPRAWLAYVLRTIADHPAWRLDGLLPWKWRKTDVTAAAA